VGCWKATLRWTRWLFTPAFGALCAIAFTLALGITLASASDVARALQALSLFESLVLAWITLTGVVVIHEFAHGLSCKYFGGHVHEMGFMLLFFQPALYCNVSDAWLFPERSKRMWVGFAGVYFDLAIWSFATLAWRVLDPHTALRQMAVVVMATTGVKTLFKLNPLLRFDGYYLLGDTSRSRICGSGPSPICAIDSGLSRAPDRGRAGARRAESDGSISSTGRRRGRSRSWS
jgi:hypothetical protein